MANNNNNNSNTQPYGTPRPRLEDLFPKPDPAKDARKVPFYPEGENVPTFGEVFVQANQHLIDAAKAPRTPSGPLTRTAAELAATGWVRPQDRQVASTPPADTPAKVIG